MKTKIVRPVLVESNELPKIGDLCFSPRYKNKLLIFGSFENSYQDECRKQQLILISLEDKFEVEDIVCDGIKIMNATPKIVNAQHLIDRREWRKVIATQTQLSPEYIQQFIEEYNKGDVKDVEIEMEYITTNEDWSKTPVQLDGYYQPKLTNGYVTIVNTIKAEEKLWTNEEVEILLGKAFDKAATYAGFSTYYCVPPEKYAKEWFNQHKK